MILKMNQYIQDANIALQLNNESNWDTTKDKRHIKGINYNVKKVQRGFKFNETIGMVTDVILYSTRGTKECNNGTLKDIKTDKVN